MRSLAAAKQTLLSSAALLTIAGALWPLVAAPPLRLAGSRLPVAITVWLLFFVADTVWIPVEFGPRALTLTMSELALVPGLLYLPISWLLGMRILTALVDDLRVRRSAYLMICNQSAMTFETLTVAAVIGLGNVGAAPVLTTSLMVTVVAGCACATVSSNALLTGFITRRGARSPKDRDAESITLLASGASGMLMSGLALVGVVLAQNQKPLLLALGAFLAWGIFNARKWVTTAQRLQRTRRLYEFARLLETSPDSQAGAGAILDEIKQILAARRVELVLPSTINRDERVVFATDGPPAVTTLDERSLAALAGELGPITHVRAKAGQPDADLEARGAKELLLAPLRATGDSIDGLLTIVDRVGNVTGFTDEDQNLLQTLASHLGLWLERGKLSEQLSQELKLREHQALHDDLTSLPNRRGLAEASTHFFDTPAKPGTVNALALVDLNRFKEINDTLGHTIGDRLLGHVATRLRNTLPRTWIVCRLGGDEFVVMAGGIDSVEVIGRTVRSILRDHYHLDGVEVLVDAAIGIAIVGEHGDDIETLLRHADVAMYDAKRHHVPFAVYSEPAITPSRDRLSITAQLDRGIRNHELVVYYQPKLDLASGIVAGFEALVRWQHPNGELVPPDTFIPLAEDSGLAGPLFANVLGQALHQMHLWHLDGLDMNVAVNMSARNLSDPTLVATVTEALERYDIPRGHLTLELTETAAVTNHEVAVQSLTALRALGVRTSLDDFGTGNSPLRLLHELPVDELKIDRSFVRAMSSDPSGRHIVANLVQLARDLGKSIVAEGVEDATIHGLLVGMGCDYGQGYHYARPADAETTTLWLRQHLENAGVHRPLSLEAPESFGLYAVLGVSSDATRLDITRAYAAAYHLASSTAAGGDRSIETLRTAFEVLSNPTMRVHHDREHRAATNAAVADTAAVSTSRALPGAPTDVVPVTTAADADSTVDGMEPVLAHSFGRAMAGRGTPRSA